METKVSAYPKVQLVRTVEFGVDGVDEAIRVDKGEFSLALTLTIPQARDVLSRLKSVLDVYDAERGLKP